MKIKCDACNQEVCVPMHFSHECIVANNYPQYMATYYIAKVVGRCICIHCGHTISKEFEHSVSSTQIAQLATQRYKEGATNDEA